MLKENLPLHRQVACCCWQLWGSSWVSTQWVPHFFPPLLVIKNNDFSKNQLESRSFPYDFYPSFRFLYGCLLLECQYKEKSEVKCSQTWNVILAYYTGTQKVEPGLLKAWVYPRLHNNPGIEMALLHGY